MENIKKMCCKFLLLAFVFALAFEPLSVVADVEKDGYARDDYDFLGFSCDNLYLHPSDGSIQTAGTIYWSCSGKVSNSGTAAYVSSWISNGFLTFQGLRLDVYKVEQVYNHATGQYEGKGQLVNTCFANSYNDIRVVRFSENGSVTLTPGEYTFVLKATFSNRPATICSHNLTVADASAVKATAKPSTTAKPNSSTTKSPSSNSTTTKTWSSWSGWSTTPVSSSPTRQVETKEETKVTTEKVYRYSRWKYYNTAYKTTYYSYTEYTGSSYKKGSGKWEYKTTTAPLSKTKVVGGRQQYSGYWYNQETSTKEVNTTVIYYRYRDLNSK